MEIIESELPHEIDPKLAPIIKRAVHTAADFDYVDNLCFSEDVVDKALEAIKNGACIVTDTNMAKAGINSSALWVMMMLGKWLKRIIPLVQELPWIRQQAWISL